MGNTASSSLPQALEEVHQTYRSQAGGQHQVTPGYYESHSSGHDSLLLPTALTAVPASLTTTVSLYQVLDLSFNLIKEVPVELPLHLPHLRYLNLSHNRLDCLPPSLFGFLHLECLDVSHNLLTSLPASLTLLSHLTWLDVSHNQLTDLPPNMGDLKKLQKLNLSDNQISDLPPALGSLPRLSVLLADNNPLPSALQALCSLADCTDLLRLLEDRHRTGQSELGQRHKLNEFARDRGPVFDSRVLNAGSAQSLFSQLQAQAVQTGNRLLTPMIPPVDATRLDVDSLRDAILGLFYGAVIGDSLGILTEHMSAKEAAFHYNSQNINHQQMHVDGVRCR